MRIDSPIMTNAVLTGSFSGSFIGVIEPSTVITGALPEGVVSSSVQIDVEQTTNFSAFSQSIANTFSGLSSDFADITNKPTLISGSVQVDHDSTTNFAANEHIDHSSVIITAGDGLSGGGDITTSRTIDVDNTVARINANNTFSGVQTFTDLVVNGTGSFAVIQSVTGSAKIIGDSFVVVNASTPAERYAGLAVYDSGSVFQTASLFFDGQINDWSYEYTDGVGTDYGSVLFGPEYSTKGTPTYLSNNKVLKGTGGHHVAESNITDDGSTITLGSNTSVSGNITVTGTVDGRDLATDGSKLDGIAANANNYSLPSDLRGSAWLIGRDTNDYINVDTTQIDFALDGAIDMRLYNNGDLHVEGNVIGYSTSISDQKFKDDVKPIESALDKVKALKGVEYTWNATSKVGKRDLGFIAQEVEEVLPLIVSEHTLSTGQFADNPTQSKTIDYEKITAVLVEAVKEQQKQIDDLTARLNANS